MEFAEYPKSLYKSMDDMCVVLDAEEEKVARADGYDHFDVVRAKLDQPEAAKKAKKEKAE